jgi:hypothetical protein
MGALKDPLRDLRRLETEAMGPCVRCKKQLLETAMPLYMRFSAMRCGIDGQAVMRHVGLAMSIAPGADGLALAGVLGPKCEPVIVMDEHKPANVCAMCMTDPTFSVMELCAMIAESEEADGNPAA